MLKKVFPYFLLLLLLGALAMVYDYDIILSLRPQSVHSWRQGDSNSLALNYYQFDRNFFHPHSHLLGSKNNSGYAAPSEVPLLYYFVSILYRLFGYHEWLFRLTVMVIFFTGLLAIFKLTKAVTNSWFYAYAVTVLFFSSPVLVYYGNNFLSNIGSLSFVIMGWYYYYKYYLTQKAKWFYTAFIFFGLACAFKITAMISIAGLLGIEVYRAVFHRSVEKKYNTLTLRHFLLMGFCLSFSIAWLIYAKYYNALWQSGFFLATANPLWPISMTAIDKMWVFIKENVGEAYFFLPTLWLFVFLLAFIFYHKSKFPRAYFYILIFSVLTGLTFVYLQFTHIDHDYFAIDLYIIPVFIVLIALVILQQHFRVVYESKFTKATIVVFLIMNIHHCDLEMKARYDGEKNVTLQYYDFQTVRHFLRTVGIESTDTVLCFPDISPYTLTLTNQFGWTNFSVLTDDEFESKVKAGAKYLLYSENPKLIHTERLSIRGEYVTHYGNIKLYALTGGKIDRPTVMGDTIVYYDFEHDRPVGIFFSDDNSMTSNYDKTLIVTDTSSAAVKHMYNADGQQYCLMTPVTMEKNSYYELSIKLSHDSDAVLVCGASDPAKYYYNMNEKFRLPNNMDSLFLRIPNCDRLIGKKINCYLYNPYAGKIKLDDFMIRRISYRNDEL